MSRISVRSHSKRQNTERGRSERRTNGEKATSSELRNADLSLSAANTLHLQKLIGNRNVQRLISDTAPSQASTPSLQMSPPTTTEAAESPSDVIVIEEGMYIGNAEFHAKAAPLNQKYAVRFAERGWPYTDELKALWDSGDVNEFADRVAGFQYFTLKLAENDVDGVLGPKTSSGLLKHNGQPSVTSDAAPGTASDVTPGASAPANAPAPTVTDNADDAAYRDHPAVVRILTPVQQAFNVYLNVIKAKKKSDTKEEQKNPNTEEMANSREVLGNAIKEARNAVQALTAADFAGNQQDFNGARGYIYRTLSANSVHYAQGDNANVLYKIEEGKKHDASSRTCNMTVMAMMLATLGKTADDYKGGLASLLPIAKEQESNLGFSVTTEDALRSLRLPDFMQIVAIKLMGGDRGDAAKKITHHSFIIAIAREFGLTPVEMNTKGEFVSRDKPDKSTSGDGLEDSFLSHAYTQKLNMMGLLYRPSERDAMKALKNDAEYKALKDDKAKQKEYAEKYVADYVDKQRLGLIANYDTWIALDTVVRDQVVGLQSAVDSAESFDAVQPKVDEVIQALKAHKDGLPKDKYSNMKKRIDNIVKGLNEAQAKKAKPEKALKNLKTLFAGKKSPARQMEKAITDYEDNKKLYETLGEPEGAEQVLSIANYQNTVLAELQAALSAGNQVMVNLENHFVRLQALDASAVYIDDPANREETQTKITWEHARKYGYFQRYLLLAP